MLQKRKDVEGCLFVVKRCVDSSIRGCGSDR